MDTKLDANDRAVAMRHYQQVEKEARESAGQKVTFDGCGININGRRILTGARADWDNPVFIAFCEAAVSAPEILRVLARARMPSEVSK